MDAFVNARGREPVIGDAVPFERALAARRRLLDAGRADTTVLAIA